MNNKCTKKVKYIKSNAFTAGNSLGNPAASFFLDGTNLSPEQMQNIAAEHKGFVMEVVFCTNSENADCKLSYYSSECEVDFCGHGTIATMYSMIKDSPELIEKPVIMAETNRKGMVKVYNAIREEDAVYISAPNALEYPVKMSKKETLEALALPPGSIREDMPIRIIDAGLKTLIVPIKSLDIEI